MPEDAYESIPQKTSPKRKFQEISYFRIFRFATPFEIFLIFIAFVCSVIKTLAMPCVIIVYGEFCSLLVDRTYGIGTSTKTDILPIFGGGKILTNASAEENTREIYNDSIAYGGLMALSSIVLFLAGVISIDIFNFTAIRQITRMRSKFFEAIITQDIGWHDITRDQNFAVRITDDIEKIRDGISEKLSHFVYYTFGFISSFVTSLVYGWKLTLAVSVYLPLVILMNIVITKYQSKLTNKEMNAYSIAGQISEEVFSAIRTVMAFNGEKKEAERYEDSLQPAIRAGKRKGIFTGISEGVMRSLLFISCAGAFWYGVHLVLEGRGKEYREYNPGVLTIVFFAVFVGTDNVSRLAPILESFAKARSSATTIFEVIDSVSKINPLAKSGDIPPTGMKGNVEFEDVFFSYPSRDDVVVHRGLNIKVESGQTVALVGNSGCGKSSCIQLLQRFYDPIFGRILVDGIDIKKYNLNWLRSNIAIVGQEPVLFSTTIGENIRYGKPGATQKEIEAAAKASGVHKFISSLPESYETMLGEKSTQISGGQKQRIAIARALIQNPKILLLDEATSALDYHSEKVVQEALDAARKGRTTIVVSHRLSAIKNADKIYFIENGKVAEEGTHEELLQLNGKYAKMVAVGNTEVPEKETKTEPLYYEDDTYHKSFDIDSNNLQEYHEQTNKKRESIDPNSVPLLSNVKKLELEDDEVDASYCEAFKRILVVCKSEWLYLVFGILLALVCGVTYPAYAVIFGEFYAALAYVDDDMAIQQTRLLCIICLCLGVVAAVIGFLQTYLFNVASLNLTLKMRVRAFKSIITQEVGWFDDEKNRVGALSARLSGDGADVNGAIGYPLSGIIQAFTNMIVSIGIAFYYSWKLTLLCLASVPFIAGSVIFEAKYMGVAALEEKELLEQAATIAIEAITNIRTVAGLRRETSIITEYKREIAKVEQRIKKKLRWRGTVNSLGQAIPFFAYAAALCYGGTLVAAKETPFQDTIKVSEVLLYGAMILGQSLAFAPAFTSSLVAALRLFHLIDRTPRIRSSNLARSNQKDLGHNVAFTNVYFKYPQRPDAAVLQGFSLEIAEGKTIALVGPSGSGKSTCVQLLQRFYQADNGIILIGQNDICKDLTLPGLRQKLGIVSQEPVLFERTIAENIAYGDNSRHVPLVEIMDCAKMANVHNFISSLPLGYETRLGSKGSQVSGGEKQRIAIARALVRNPKILLLDEATSALDLQSEKIVQAALEFACSGRTCIVIAHRLSSVQNADLICVVNQGKIVEKGTHAQLLAHGGIYARLYKTQPKVD